MTLPQRLRARARDFLVRGRPELRLAVMLLRPRRTRDTEAVVGEYTASWATHRRYLDRVKSLDEWLFVPGFEDRPKYYNLGGRMRRTVFNSGGYFLAQLGEALLTHFPDCRSITEYGCGMGRNLLHLKRRFPDLACYGYELCDEGVEVSRLAAAKFQLDVRYEKLDFVHSPPEAYVLPPTDVAFTMFALEQVPREAEPALRHLHERVAMGSIHLEPVVENYPWNYPGLLGRLYHQRVDYLRDFPAIARRALVPMVEERVLRWSHNPVVYPSRYVFKKG